MNVLVRFRMNIEVKIGFFSLENARVAIGVTCVTDFDFANEALVQERERERE